MRSANTDKRQPQSTSCSWRFRFHHRQLVSRLCILLMYNVQIIAWSAAPSFNFVICCICLELTKIKYLRILTAVTYRNHHNITLKQYLQKWIDRRSLCASVFNGWVCKIPSANRPRFPYDIMIQQSSNSPGCSINGRSSSDRLWALWLHYSNACSYHFVGISARIWPSQRASIAAMNHRLTVGDRYKSI